MPWLPELFSAPVLERVLEQRRREQVRSVPYFAGLLSGDIDALLGSFVGEPELFVPLRGRIKGEQAFRAFVGEMIVWFDERNIDVEHVVRGISGRRGFEEAVLRLDGDAGRIGLPHALVADHAPDGRLEELRIYHSRYPLNGRHVNRPPVLQPNPELRASDVVAEYHEALAAGDVDGIVAAFEPDGYAQEPAGGEYVHRGHDALRAFYERQFSNDGGIRLEHCGLADDGHSSVLEYNVVRWGKTDLPPQAGVAVYVRGQSGKLAAARIYDDADPPVGATS
jgi:ketosteroid isomerase-like protein